MRLSLGLQNSKERRLVSSIITMHTVLVIEAIWTQVELVLLVVMCYVKSVMLRE